MRLYILSFIFALFAVSALAKETERKSIIVTYEKGVPDWVIDQAKDTFRAAVCCSFSLWRPHANHK